MLDCDVRNTDTERSADGGTADLLAAQRPDRSRAEGCARLLTLCPGSPCHKSKTVGQRMPTMTFVTDRESGLKNQ